MTSAKDGKARRKGQTGKIPVFEDKTPQLSKPETKKLVVEERGIQTESTDISSMISGKLFSLKCYQFVVVKLE